MKRARERATAQQRERARHSHLTGRPKLTILTTVEALVEGAGGMGLGWGLESRVEGSRKCKFL